MVLSSAGRGQDKGICSFFACPACFSSGAMMLYWYETAFAVFYNEGGVISKSHLLLS
jgi:hypothetical protein